jgi:hypothetical protein
MEFTKDKVEYYWKILNGHSSTDERKQADEYLINFKVIYIIFYNFIIINSVVKKQLKYVFNYLTITT